MCCSVLPLLVTLLLSDITASWEERGVDYKYGGQAELQDKQHFCTWKCLQFTLQWPGAFCKSLKDEILCIIPPGIDSWTIHGLWPMKAHSCCNCWPMFPSDVQELEAELSQHWPSLLKIKSSFRFWNEEWRKHGACAACVEGLNSPLRFFQICLKLRARYDFHRFLEEAGITPSCERVYKAEEVNEVLVPHLGDQYEIQCITDDQGREVWFQVKVKLSRNLTIGCDHHGDPSRDPGPGLSEPSSGHPCPPHVPVYYYPINHQQPQRPCG
ncbi:ribonuclease T2-like isoform X2 [Mugil cephalus]|uniref:ribonuclease T2-like isoform X2 n=1 Tax=Mugil cephalus TaxID=48193 RepID=UPI001FB7540D|nr:ribonuclease T2-like isoform X2 [Mugil cephalus]